ncbi:hypothetical protein ACQEVC_45525 [Plantactinospora sp. CA-294935]|uniref:hypothetical protein n=1 Tax=Plantactinospora sp. CA-294935 TaxID=3240012 RepID=UPI003D8BFB50
MARKLNAFVTVHRRDDKGELTGESVTVGPNDDLSRPELSWVESAITNPDVWADAAKPTPAGESVGPQAPAGDGPPPKGGAGSGAPEWRAYAARKGVEVPDDASRDDVIAALSAANVPTE